MINCFVPVTVSICHYFTHGNVLILIIAPVVLYNVPF